MTDILSAVLMITGGLFFLAGTLGLLRFPDIYTRLHALTKADNVGLGFIVTGMMFQVDSWPLAGKLLLTWLLVLVAGSSVSYLIARGATQKKIKPWKR